MPIHPPSHPNANLYAEAFTYATFAMLVYEEDGGTPPEGWEKLVVPEESENWLDELHEFFFAFYRHLDTGEVILAFRGTARPMNWLSNAINKLGGFSAHNNLARSVVGGCYKIEGLRDKLTIVGHSLGGNLAMATAYRTGAKAFTFNAASVSRSFVAWTNIRGENPTDSKIQNFYHEKDPLYSIVDYWNILTIRLGRVHVFSQEDYFVHDALHAHSMEPMVKFLSSFESCK